MPEIVIDRTATTDRRIKIVDSFGQWVQMSVDQFRRLAAEGVTDRFQALARQVQAPSGKQRVPTWIFVGF
jgi:hypothetical protein